MQELGRRDVLGWALYDFGSSAFNTLVVTFIFSRFFADVIATGDNGAILWGWSLNASAVAVAVMMPVLGAIADYSGRKKTFLVGFALQAIVFTILLFFMGPGQALPAAVLFVLANIGFEASNVFYNAFLPEIADSRTIGRISGFGFCLGYVGGLGALAISLGMISSWVPDTDYLNIRSTLLLVAAWYFLFSIPLFVGLTERAERRSLPLRRYVAEGFGRLGATVRHVGELREAVKLLVARMIYNDGLVTIIGMAAIYSGAVLAMPQEAVLSMAIALNVAAGLGALGFGFVDDRIGGKRTLIITLVGLIAAGAYGVWTTTQTGFWVAATLIGVMLGPNQSASRSLLAKLVPEHKHAEAFGLYAFSGKMSSLLGPLAYTTVLTLTDNNHRLAMSTILLFFVVGLGVLLFVREDEGTRIARQLASEFDSASGNPEGPASA